MIKFTQEKIFSKEALQDLFLSVDWRQSAQNPLRLYKAMINSSTVITAWDKDKLVGLARAIDDGELLAYIHYVLVQPDYQKRGIASEMLDIIKAKYKDYLYIEVMPDEKVNVDFYLKHGFKIVHTGTPMQRCNLSNAN